MAAKVGRAGTYMRTKENGSTLKIKFIFALAKVEHTIDGVEALPKEFVFLHLPLELSRFIERSFTEGSQPTTPCVFVNGNYLIRVAEKILISGIPQFFEGKNSANYMTCVVQQTCPPYINHTKEAKQRKEQYRTRVPDDTWQFLMF
ncbi:hypothetical protein Pelo_13102 [Pelomyxa schiedti]|nr:hypothetical protein Pelo_13102 [Pelomyxa schiedti]